MIKISIVLWSFLGKVKFWLIRCVIFFNEFLIIELSVTSIRSHLLSLTRTMRYSFWNVVATLAVSSLFTVTDSTLVTGLDSMFYMSRKGESRWLRMFSFLFAIIFAISMKFFLSLQIIFAFNFSRNKYLLLSIFVLTIFCDPANLMKTNPNRLKSNLSYRTPLNTGHLSENGDILTFFRPFCAPIYNFSRRIKKRIVDMIFCIKTFLRRHWELFVKIVFFLMKVVIFLQK